MKKALIFFALAASFQLSSDPVDHFPFDPPTNFSLFINEGRIHHPVSTKNVEAQKYFNQGLTLVYGFNHDAAYWSFKKAAELDPHLAMAYWGMALALGENINVEISEVRQKKAYELIQKALSLAPSATDNEQAYIEALSKRYTNEPNPDRKQLTQNYFKAMEKVKNRFPDDLDAATLFAESGLDLSPWKQWTNQGEPKPGTLELVAVLESVIKRDPKHLGANHYYIHVVEASNHPERALMSAERLRRLLPASGHILHMPGHIYLLVGDYHLAAQCNEEAVRIDKEYIKQFGMTGLYPLHYMSHNLYFLSRSYSMEGRFEDAKRAGEELRAFYAPHFKIMPELEYYVPTSLFVLMRFHKWNEILSWPYPPNEMAITQGLWHFARSMAFTALNRPEEAAKERNLFLERKKTLKPETMYGSNKALTLYAIADLTLQAKMAEMRGNLGQAIVFLKQAVEVQDQLYYNEPPDWFFPVRESLGGVYLLANQPQEAEKTFREDLNKHPRNGRSLFGLWKSLQAQGREADAYWVKREWEEAWKHSTVPLSVQDL